MCTGFQIGTLALGGLGLGAGIFGSKKAGKQSAKQYSQQYGIQQKQIAKAEAEAERKYKADIANYGSAKEVYEKNLAYLDALIADPTGHPEYAGAKEGLEKAFGGARTSLKQSLRRRGRTIGIQDRALMDLTEAFEGQLTTIHTGIAAKAREQRLGLRKPPEPYKGMGQVDWGTYMQATSTPSVDLSGFGQMLALSMMDKSDTTPDTKSTLAKSGGQLPYYLEPSTYEIEDWTKSA